MLQFIRDRAQSWIAWVIISLIIIPFALWGINQYFDGGTIIPAARVGDSEISPQRLQQALSQQQQRLRDMLGANYRADMFPEEQMRQQVLQGLIEQELLVQAAAASGMRVSDAMLAQTIRSIPSFQEGGEFSQTAYERALRAQGMLPGGFEAELRRDILTQQFYIGVVRSAFTTEAERHELNRLLAQQRDVGHLLLPVQNFVPAVQVSEDEVRSFYESQGRLFMEPERVAVSYLELSAEAIAAGISVAEDELLARYQAQLVNYQEPEQRQVRHILLQLEANADEAAVQVARTRADDLLKQLRAGASFEALAKQHSNDPGSAAQGGDLGFFGRGVMDKAFEEAAFALKKGELSAPVRSAFGFHILRLDGVRGGATKSFADVRAQILAEVRNERADQQYYEQAEQLANLTYEHPDTLDEAVRQLGLKVNKSELFSRRGGQGLLANPRLVTAAFSEDVLARGNNSEVLEAGNKHLVVLRVAEHHPEALRPLESVRGDITVQLRRNKAQQAAQQAADEMIQRLRDGAEPQALAKAHKAKWERTDGLLRTGSKVDPAVVQAVFAMARPDTNAPVLQRITTAAGDQAVIVLYAVREAEAREADGTAGDGSELERTDGEAAFTSVLNGMRARADIKIPQVSR